MRDRVLIATVFLPLIVKLLGKSTFPSVLFGKGSDETVKEIVGLVDEGDH